jgi:Skp family chaperone for outer membrane proteins
MNGFKKLLSFVVLLVIIAIPVTAVANANELMDWWKLRDYTAPADVAQLATEDTMTDKARHLFYVNHPQLLSDKTQFRNFCTISEQTIVLGCYHGVENGIALYNVSDSRLSGVQEVTAAHETLHAAYDRLGSSEKNTLNAELTDFYNNGLHDQRIIDTINSYKKTEPNDVVNEMHSVFGTEVTNLPAPLESYYKQYFSNRTAVVNFSNQYESVFTQNQQQLDNLKNEIDSLKTELTTDKQNIEDEESLLSSRNSQMRQLLASGNNGAYNAQVGSYNAQVQRVRSDIADYNAKVNKINSLVEKYNSIAYTQESLYNALDTRLQTQTAQ